MYQYPDRRSGFTPGADQLLQYDRTRGLSLTRGERVCEGASGRSQALPLRGHPTGPARPLAAGTAHPASAQSSEQPSEVFLLSAPREAADNGVRQHDVSRLIEGSWVGVAGRVESSCPLPIGTDVRIGTHGRCGAPGGLRSRAQRAVEPAGRAAAARAGGSAARVDRGFEPRSWGPGVTFRFTAPAAGLRRIPSPVYLRRRPGSGRVDAAGPRLPVILTTGRAHHDHRS